MKVLYDLIHYKANQTWQNAHNSVTITIDNFEVWRDCWINTARLIQAQMQLEGLAETAKEMGRIIDFELKSYSKWKDK